ncbi:MAG: hypothetical protein ACLR7D_07230 [Lachnospira eligens]
MFFAFESVEKTGAPKEDEWCFSDMSTRIYAETSWTTSIRISSQAMGILCFNTREFRHPLAKTNRDI